MLLLILLLLRFRVCRRFTSIRKKKKWRRKNIASISVSNPHTYGYMAHQWNVAPCTYDHVCVCDFVCMCGYVRSWYHHCCCYCCFSFASTSCFVICFRVRRAYERQLQTSLKEYIYVYNIMPYSSAYNKQIYVYRKLDIWWKHNSQQCERCRCLHTHRNVVFHTFWLCVLVRVCHWNWVCVWASGKKPTTTATLEYICLAH